MVHRQPVPDFHRYVLAVNRVERLLRKVTRALDDAEVPYAVIGGNAVGAWVGSVDPEAIRATKNVDVMIRRADLGAMAEALKPAGSVQDEVLGITIFVLRRRPSPKTGVHLIFANERVNPQDKHPSADVDPPVREYGGFRIVDLPGLVTMKLQAYRLHDRVHIIDLASVGLIDESFAAKIPEDLRSRLLDVLEEGRRQGLGIHGRPPCPDHLDRVDEGTILRTMSIAVPNQASMRPMCPCACCMPLVRGAC